MIEAPSPALIKTQEKSTNQKVYSEMPKEAYEWMISHQG
jgi:hypothetical protein